MLPINGERSVGGVPKGWSNAPGERDQHARHTLALAGSWPAASQTGQTVGGGFAQQAILPLVREEVSVVGKHQIISIRLVDRHRSTG
jgi:hypothetical protein